MGPSQQSQYILYGHVSPMFSLWLEPPADHWEDIVGSAGDSDALVAALGAAPFFPQPGGLFIAARDLVDPRNAALLRTAPSE